MASMKTLIIRLERLDPSLIPVKEEVKDEPLTSEGEDCDEDSSAIADNPWTPAQVIDSTHTKIYQEHLKIIQPDKPFRCGLCEEGFNRRDNLASHFKNTHSHETDKTKRTFKCDICSKIFSFQFHYQHHYIFCSSPRSATDPDKRKCTLCPKEFSNPRLLKVHLKRVHYPKSKVNCDICQKAFSRMSHVSLHKAAVHNGLRFKCQVPNCSKIFARFHTLQKHSRREHSLRLRSSGTGSEQFILPDDILTAPEKAKPKVRKCIKCNKTFDLKYHLDQHQKCCLNPNSKNYMCTLCGTGFRWYTSYRRHFKANHATPNDSKTIPCGICSRKFKDSKTAQAHRSKTHGWLKISCNVDGCTQRFPSNIGLWRHKQAYHQPQSINETDEEKDFSESLQQKEASGECQSSDTVAASSPPETNLWCSLKELYFFNEEINRFQCKLCPNKYKDKGSWLFHYKKIHLGIETPNAFMCDLCGKTFNVTRRLIRHKLTCGKSQSEDKLESLECMECNKTFKTSYGLRKHQTVHAADKDSLSKYMCDLCGKSFTRGHRLREHRAWTHFGIKVKCKVPGCDKSYTCAAALAKHFRVDHKEEKRKFGKINLVEANLPGQDLENDKSSQALASSLVAAEENISSDNLPEVPSSSPCPSPSIPASPQVKEEIEVDLPEYPESSEIKIQLQNFENSNDFEASNPLHSSPATSGSGSDDGSELEPPTLNDSYSILKSGKFKCKLCSKIYTKKTHLKSHFDSIHLKIKFKCNLCPKLYTTRDNLKLHIEQNHPSFKKLFICSICNKKFYFESDLKYHFKMKHNPSRNLKCPHCPLIFKKKRELNNHLKDKHYGMITVNNDLSSSSLIAAVSFKEINKQLAILPTGFQCKVCTKIFNQRIHFQVHYRYVHLGIRYKCESCGKTFSSIYDLKTHWTHDCAQPNDSPEVGPSQTKICHLCGKELKSFKSLRCHMNSRHPKNNQKARPFLCEFCTLSFITKTDLNDHINAKHLNQRLNCDYPGCGKNYAFPSALRKHKKVEHREDKPKQDKPVNSKADEDVAIYNDADYIDNYEPLKNNKVKCKVCFTNFLKMDSFKLHFQSTHLKHKLKCEKCNKRFTKKENFNNHQKVCSLPLEFKCDICPKEYVSNVYLQRHIKRDHLMKVKCDLCDLEFKQKRSLKGHMNSIHLKIRYSCDVKGCEKSYTTIYSLKTHKKIEH